MHNLPIFHSADFLKYAEEEDNAVLSIELKRAAKALKLRERDRFHMFRDASRSSST